VSNFSIVVISCSEVHMKRRRDDIVTSVYIGIAIYMQGVSALHMTMLAILSTC